MDDLTYEYELNGDGLLETISRDPDGDGTPESLQTFTYDDRSNIVQIEDNGGAWSFSGTCLE